jgi:putative peptidoglycan lipid II flippase
MEQHRVIRSAAKVGSFTLLSRFLGLIRDTLTASAFGISPAMSDFVVAFRLPNLFRALFGEGALSSAFVPVFMATRKQDGEAAAWLVARKTLTVVAVFLAALVAVLIGGLWLLEHLRPDLAARAPHLLPLMRIMMPYVLLICLAGLLMAMLNACHQFSLPAFTPSLLNITWILTVLFVCPHLGATQEQQIYGVAWAVVVAGGLQLGVQLPALMRRGFKPGFTWDTADARVRRVFALMGPTALGQSVTQVNVMVNTLLARWAAPWAPASLFFAERLLYFPQGLLATALSTVLLPVLSGHAAKGDHEQMRATINHGLRTLLFVMIPASVGLLTLADPITRLIFGWGVFDAAAVDHTSIAVQFYAPGLMVFCLAKVFVPAFYALQDTRTPFPVGPAGGGHQLHPQRGVCAHLAGGHPPCRPRPGHRPLGGRERLAAGLPAAPAARFAGLGRHLSRRGARDDRIRRDGSRVGDVVAGGGARAGQRRRARQTGAIGRRAGRHRSRHRGLLRHRRPAARA